MNEKDNDYHYLFGMRFRESESKFGKGTHTKAIAFNGGITIGDASDAYTANTGIDLLYLYSFGKYLSIGGTTGIANYFGGEFTETIGVNTVTADVDDTQFVPLALSVRINRFDKFVFGGDMGYAFSLTDGIDGGFYTAPKLTYIFSDKIVPYIGYRMIRQDGDNIGSIQVGIEYSF